MTLSTVPVLPQPWFVHLKHLQRLFRLLAGAHITLRRCVYISPSASHHKVACFVSCLSEKNTSILQFFTHFRLDGLFDFYQLRNPGELIQADEGYLFSRAGIGLSLP